jgi:GNAT superfamily N-acetyltransferase
MNISKTKHERLKKEILFTRSTGMCFGLIYGVTIGVATHNIGLCLPFGLCFGICIGAAMEKRSMKKQKEIRKIISDEIPVALDLAWRVFSEYESPDYSEEGTEEFRKCLHDEEYLTGIEYYGAFDAEKLIGIIGIRPDRKHICFFFVDGKYQRQGIGTRLFKTVLQDYPEQTITVNSSPYGVPFYHALGFENTDKEQTVNGIRFTPMQREVNGDGSF